MAGKPKPTHLKVITGNPGKRPLNKREPIPSENLSSAPEWMTESQQLGWKYAIDNAPKGLLKSLDKSTLTAWVLAEDIHRQAAEMLAKEGLLTAAPNTGLLIQSPYLPIVNKQAVIMMKAASELGFNPTARSRIVIAEETVGDDPWARLAAAV